MDLPTLTHPPRDDTPTLCAPRLRLRLAPTVAHGLIALAPPWPDADGVRCWSIESTHTRQALGLAALRQRVGDAFEPWVAVLPAQRGRGLASEALRALLRQAGQRCGGRFIVVCPAHDHAADRLLRRVGFVVGYEADGVPWRLRQYVLAPAD